MLSVTDNCWRTPLHILLSRGHLAAALRLLSKHSVRLDQADLSGDTIASLLLGQRQEIVALLWRLLLSGRFEEFEQTEAVLER